MPPSRERFADIRTLLVSPNLVAVTIGRKKKLPRGSSSFIKSDVDVEFDDVRSAGKDAAPPSLEWTSIVSCAGRGGGGHVGSVYAWWHGLGVR